MFNYKFGFEILILQDDTQATRTLYIGNLLGDVRESELRRIFEVYGVIDEIEVKVLSNTAAFAFVLYRVIFF